MCKAYTINELESWKEAELGNFQAPVGIKIKTYLP